VLSDALRALLLSRDLEQAGKPFDSKQELLDESAHKSPWTTTPQDGDCDPDRRQHAPLPLPAWHELQSLALERLEEVEPSGRHGGRSA
jgi:hypothetical protein